MAISPHGLAFVSFGGTFLTITSVQVSDTKDLSDATHLGVSPNARRVRVGVSAVDREVTADVIGNAPVQVGSSGDISFRISDSGLILIGRATVQSSSFSASTGDIVRGTVVWKLQDQPIFEGFA
jgi:hypothetical protein